MLDQQSSYRQIFKATSLFGGVQVFQILITIIRTKFVAVLLGPTGMGINGLLNATTGMIAGLTNFGIGTSAIKNVAAAFATGDSKRVATVVGVMRKLVWVTGSLGALATLVFSPWLSELTFGNREYTLAFVWISVTLLLNQISSGQGVVLRGTRQLKYLAQAGLSGAFLGLIVSVPMYYLWGIDGIVPAIIVSSVASLFRTWYFSRKVKIDKVEVKKETIIKEGKGMLTMGFMLSLTGILSLAVGYIVKIYISKTGGVDQVGLFTAGFAIINTYVGMIFTAMSTDYYPRLSGVAHDNVKAASLINQQCETAILILAPLLTTFIIYIQPAVILLYSTKFTAVNGMIQWASLGMYFRAAGWAIAIILLAKGASKLYFWNQFISKVYFLGFHVLGYRLGGLNGLGVSFLATFILYFVQVLVLSKYKYKLILRPAFVRIFLIQLVLGTASFLVIRLMPTPQAYFVGTGIIAMSSVLSFRELDKRMEFKSILQGLKSKVIGKN